MALKKAGKGSGTDIEKGFLLAYRAIGRREYSVSEMREYLKGKGVSCEKAEEIVKQLVKENYLNDARFCSAAIRDKKNIKGYGPHRIVQFLRSRGIAEEEIEAGMGEEFDENGEEERRMIQNFLQRKKLSPKKDAYKLKQSLFGMLLRKGFSPALIQEEIKAFLHG